MSKLRFSTTVVLGLALLTLSSTGFGQRSTPPAALVSVEVLFMQVSADTAAGHGLDGGPALDEDAVPVRKILAPEEAKRLISSLRRDKRAVIAGSGRCVSLSGNTVIYRNVKELKLDGKESRDCGVILEVTPTVHQGGTQVDLELRPQLVRFAGWADCGDSQTPAFSVISVETRATLPLGSTLILGGGSPALETATPLVRESDAAELPGFDDRCVVIFITASLATSGR